jgi:anionic cell wall polymer biosynthesis LytR-Cps2A-Psr (LCP) family protein
MQFLRFYKGVNHVNGEEALAFSRNRYAFGSGDIQRGQNQMLMLTAIINKLMSPSLLQNPSGVLDVVGKSMQTSIGSSEIVDAIAWQLDTMGEWSINRQSVTGTGDSDQTFSMKGIDLYVMWPNEDSVSRAAEKIEAVMEKTEED